MRKFLIILALAVPACTNTAMPGTGETPMLAASSQTAASPTEYVAMAGASDLYEIESSRLALQKSADPRVQQFARMMIDHHTKTTKTIMDAARDAGVNPAPPQLLPMQRDLISELRNQEGTSFDRTYLSQQRRAHDMALALHSGYASEGGSAPLRLAAQTAVPIIQEHIRNLRSLPAT